MCLDVAFVLYLFDRLCVSMSFLFDRLCVWMSLLFCICLTAHVFECRFCLIVYAFGC